MDVYLTTCIAIATGIVIARDEFKPVLSIFGNNAYCMLEWN